MTPYQHAKQQLVKALYGPDVRRRCKGFLELAFTNTTDKVKLLEDLDLARKLIGAVVDAELAEQTAKGKKQ